MNCCDASGRCTNGNNCATRNPVPLRFAPGVIERTQRQALGNAQQRRVLWRWAFRLGFAVLLCGAAGIGGVIAATLIHALGH